MIWENFEQCEQGKNWKGWFFYIESKIGLCLGFKIIFLEVYNSYLTPYTQQPISRIPYFKNYYTPISPHLPLNPLDDNWTQRKKKPSLDS
jgi:hypothetical protein